MPTGCAIEEQRIVKYGKEKQTGTQQPEIFVFSVTSITRSGRQSIEMKGK